MISFIPNAGKVVPRSLAVIGGVVSQVIPFALQAAGDHIAVIPNITDSTRSLMQLALALVLVPLGKAIQQNLAARFPPADAA
jgi:hypothetical protein